MNYKNLLKKKRIFKSHVAHRFKKFVRLFLSQFKKFFKKQGLARNDNRKTRAHSSQSTQRISQNPNRHDDATFPKALPVKNRTSSHLRSNTLEKKYAIRRRLTNKLKQFVSLVLSISKKKRVATTDNRKTPISLKGSTWRVIRKVNRISAHKKTSLSTAPSIKKRFRSHLGFVLNQARSHFIDGHFYDFNQISDGLYVGRIPGSAIAPSKIMDTCEKSGRKLALVISLVEDWEKQRTLFFTKTKNSEWADLEVKQISVPAADHQAGFDNNVFLTALLEARRCIEKGESVYIHCREGKGRAATFAIAYYAMYGLPHERSIDIRSNPDAKIKEILDYVKQRRQIIRPNQRQLEFVKRRIWPSIATRESSCYTHP